MADLAYSNQPPAVTLAGPNWGAIWSGMFAFIGIWAVFGLLGEAIFASAATPNTGHAGLDWGMGIWTIVLTIIAMYVGGRVTSGLSGATSRRAAMLQGQTMFGLAVVAATIILVLGGASLNGGAAASAPANSPWALTMLSGLGWIGFFSLFFGWLACLGGATHAVNPVARVVSRDKVRDIRAA